MNDHSGNGGDEPKGSWDELFRDGMGLYSALIIGGIANEAGSGNAPDPAAVAHAVIAVYYVCWIPLGLAALFMFRFMRVGGALIVPVPASAD
jgi:hypothetical protein